MSRFIRTAALAAVAAVLLVPAGQAMTLISDNSPSQNRLGQTPYVPYVHSPGLGAVEQRPVSFTSENAPSQNRISLLNAAETGTTGSGSNGFDWTDAGIGAVVAAGLALLLAGGGVTISRRNGARSVAL